jgi:hypothetical protein
MKADFATTETQRQEKIKTLCVLRASVVNFISFR